MEWPSPQVKQDFKHSSLKGMGPAKQQLWQAGSGDWISAALLPCHPFLCGAQTAQPYAVVLEEREEVCIAGTYHEPRTVETQLHILGKSFHPSKSPSPCL